MKTVLITGISKGIGQALANKFLSEGYKVIGTTTTGTASITNENLVVQSLELSVPGSIEKCVGSIIDSQTTIDILINNAGVLRDEEETTVNIPKLRETLEINLIGTIDFTERLILSLAKDGHIVFLSTQAGSLSEMDHISDSHSPYYYPAYKISKCALNMYVRTLAARFVHVGEQRLASAVHPGWVRTEMGGEEAPVTPEEAANDIYKLAVSRPENGQFWYKGEKFPW